MIYDKNYWATACCDFCGTKSQGKVFVKVIVPVDNDEMQYPYEEINMCEEHFKEIDITELIKDLQDK